MADNGYEDFREIIRNMIKEENEIFLKENNFYTSYTGTITGVSTDVFPFTQVCSIDLFFTQLTGILNKSGELLEVGDTVTVLERYGSNFSNCFIGYKNGIGEPNDGTGEKSELVLGETENTAYRGDRGKIAFDHANATIGSNPHGTTFANILDKPTTAEGYGITNVMTTNIFTEAPTNNLLVKNTTYQLGELNNNMELTLPQGNAGDFCRVQFKEGTTAYDVSFVGEVMDYELTFVANRYYEIYFMYDGAINKWVPNVYSLDS